MKIFPEKISVKTWLGVVLGILLLAVYSCRLWFPAEPYYDETHYVNFIRALLEHHRYLETANVHPPLWHLLTAGVVSVLGDHAVAWRLVSLIAGLLSFVPMYLIARKLTGSAAFGLLAIFLFAFDCLSLTQARVAMMNAQMLLFSLCSILFFLKAFEQPDRVKRRALIGAGVFLGLALSTKMVAMSLYFFFIPLLVMEAVKRKEGRGPFIAEALLWMAVIPVVFFIAAQSWICFLTGLSWGDMAGIWKFHMNYNLTTTQTHPYASRWWAWSLMMRPIWFYFESRHWGTPQAVVSGIFGIGNPLIFWMIPLAVYHLLLNFFFEKSRAAGLVLLGFFSQLLAFGLMQRFQFFHYFYSAVPFVVLAVMLLIKRLWEWGGFWRGVVVVYLVLVAGMFVYWYPLLTGIPVSGSFFHQHIWFKSWV